jgi:hypothetical protein
MLSRFRELCKFVADESRAGDEGLKISCDTRVAYQEMLDLYERALTPWLVNASAEEVSAHFDVYQFVQDYMRTIYMIRAMNRLILLKQNERLCGGRIRNVKVVEAGCGSGFLTGVALALSDRVSVQAFDYHPVAVATTSIWVAALGKQRKAQVVQRNLLRPCFDVETDILIAEHLALGLKGEHCIQIPRNFNVDPLFAVPYAVIPAIHWESAWPGAGVVKGGPIILADRKGRDQFLVRGDLALPPRTHIPVNVGTDVLWGCRYEGYGSLHQRLDPQYVYWPGMVNYLLKVHTLINHEDRTTALALKNDGDEWATTDYQLAYPVGQGFNTQADLRAIGDKVRVAPYRHGIEHFLDPYNYGLLQARRCK